MVFGAEPQNARSDRLRSPTCYLEQNNPLNGTAYRRPLVVALPQPARDRTSPPRPGLSRRLLTHAARQASVCPRATVHPSFHRRSSTVLVHRARPPAPAVTPAACAFASLARYASGRLRAAPVAPSPPIPPDAQRVPAVPGDGSPLSSVAMIATAWSRQRACHNATARRRRGLAAPHARRPALRAADRLPKSRPIVSP